jgi:hypothetical protein
MSRVSNFESKAVLAVALTASFVSGYVSGRNNFSFFFMVGFIFSVMFAIMIGHKLPSIVKRIWTLHFSWRREPGSIAKFEVNYDSRFNDIRKPYGPATHSCRKLP